MGWIAAAVFAVGVIVWVVIRRRRMEADTDPYLLDQTEQWRRMRERQRRG